MKKSCFLLLFGTLYCWANAQSEDDTFFQKLGEQIFLPSIEIGYLENRADALGGGVLMKTSLEYRVRNNNDIFFRLSYDTYDSPYTLESSNSLTDVVKGTALFTDVLLGAGYRFGDNQFRAFLMIQPGLKLYNYPNLVETAGAINIDQSRNSVFTTRTTLGFEYYINEKTAISFDLLQSQVWEEQDFWSDSGSAYGASLGFITSLF